MQRKARTKDAGISCKLTRRLLGVALVISLGNGKARELGDGKGNSKGSGKVRDLGKGKAGE